jgi:hypothetical protein
MTTHPIASQDTGTHTIAVYYDDFTPLKSPRDSAATKLVIDTRKTVFSDFSVDGARVDSMEKLGVHFFPDQHIDDVVNYIVEQARTQNLKPVELFAAAAKEKGYPLFLQVYLYEHSSSKYSLTPFTCPWDSSLCGFMFVSAEQMKEHYHLDPEDSYGIMAMKVVMENELQDYTNFCNGVVYRVIVTDNATGEVINEFGNIFTDDTETLISNTATELEASKANV